MMAYEILKFEDLTQELLLQRNVAIIPKDYDTLFEFYMFLNKIGHTFMTEKKKKKYLQIVSEFKLSCIQNPEKMEEIKVKYIHKFINFDNFNQNCINVPDIKNLWWSNVEYYENYEFEKFKIYLLVLSENHELSFDKNVIKNFGFPFFKKMSQKEQDELIDKVRKISLGNFKSNKKIPSVMEVISKLNEAFEKIKNEGSMFNPDIKLLKSPIIKYIESSEVDKEGFKYSFELILDYKEIALIEMLDECLNWSNLPIQKVNITKYKYSYEINRFAGSVSDAWLSIALNGSHTKEKLKINVKREEKTVLEFFMVLNEEVNLHPQILFKGKEFDVVEPDDFPKPEEKAINILVK